MTRAYSFKDCLARAERISWRVEDLIGGDKALDFTRPFMPESLARTQALEGLSATQQLRLNQIRGHAYLRIFGLVEEFILPFVLDHTRPLLNGDDVQVRALLTFAGEEAKHIHLFRRFATAFAEGFPVRCEVIGPPEAVARHVLSHHPLSVALVILQIEWMTQRHFQDSVRDDTGLDSQFKNLLRHHWMEEMQHAELDALLVQMITSGLDAAAIETAIDGYFAIGAFLDEGLKQQALFDLEALERVSGEALVPELRAQAIEVQHQANRWTYLGSGMSHPRFLEAVGALSPAGRARITHAAAQFS